MTRVGTRPLAALITAVLATALLAACGSSSSNDSSASITESSDSTAAGTTTQNAPQSSSTQSSPKKSPAQGPNGGQDQRGQGDQPSQTQQSNGGGSTSHKQVETPLKVSGGGSAQFRTKGGDNSIQEFGGESAESELQEAAEVVHGFYVSRAAQEWSKACSYLAKSNIEQLEQLANQSAQSQGADCATVLKAFTRPLPASVEREITTVDAGSLRRDGEQGFLIYYGAGHVKYAMPLRYEDGSWKVAALSGTTLG